MSMSDYIKNWKYQRTSVRSAFLFVLTLISFGINAQERSEVRDTVYILFERTGNTIQELGKKYYHKPELGYPNDLRRTYFIKKNIRCDSCDSKPMDRVTYAFPYDPRSTVNTYRLMPKKEFLKLDYKDQDWFHETPYESINKFLKDKVVYLVDKGYLYDDKVYLLKVFLLENTIE